MPTSNGKSYLIRDMDDSVYTAEDAEEFGDWTAFPGNPGDGI